MAIINQATKELQVKIVYYGPAMGGKTTNLIQVHDHVQTQAGNKGKLVSLATSSDRTLFFDFLPIEAMTIKGFKTKFQLYTVPGQVFYDASRKLKYRGRLDQGRTTPPPADAPRELVAAMRSIAATGSGPAEQFPPMGCSIKWKAA